MADALFVRTRFVDGLLRDLPGAGLAGVVVAADVVRIDDPSGTSSPEDLEFEVGWHADKLGLDGMAILPRHSFQEVVEYCAHDVSLSGAEGPIVELGRWPLLWRCDDCGATILEGSSDWKFWIMSEVVVRGL